MARGGKREGAGRKVGAVAQAKRDLADMAKDHASAALETLVAIHKSSTASDAARVSAATAILDRAYGKPAQALQVSGKDGESLIPPVIQILPVSTKHDRSGSAQAT